MANREKFYVGDTPLIELDCVADITGATGIKIKYKKPDKTIGDWVGSPVDKRYVTYLCKTDDLNLPGVWEFQVI